MSVPVAAAGGDEKPGDIVALAEDDDLLEPLGVQGGPKNLVDLGSAHNLNPISSAITFLIFRL